ncbi:molybdopterin cofactor-binding domain-containing protein [Novosphingobium colocasiae]|uniref:Aldehyde oxidase n=1 Tax=Novosphingobium colocasiae TaxID=1256513 RepID=A0A918PFS7_9SPHN|nr:molybdopterin cofactor-binding domain-containing protein [Novosphingobium colocasiae]GGZ03166.1 aldehyde oxidase [Novosphingobium colocasiae]
MPVTRRGLLIGALAGGGLAVGYLLRPRRFPLPLEPGRDEWAFGAWIKIDREGVVTVAVPQVEMGQGVTTLLPQVVAHELGADWRQVAVEPAPVSPIYANLPLAARWAPLWMPFLPGLAESDSSVLARRWAQDNRFNVTAEGTALAAYEPALRTAAAAARELLVQAAAARWDVAEEECRVSAGLVRQGARTLGFGALAADAAELSPPSAPPQRADPVAEKPGPVLPGRPLRYPRLDLPAKVDGSWVFAADVRLPDMVYAAIRHAPIGDAAFAGWRDHAGAAKLPGVVRLVEQERWAAAVAADWWSAERALDRAGPKFRVSHAADSQRILEAIDHAMAYGDAQRLVAEGDQDLVTGGLPVQYRYDVAPALHATLETASATARLADGRLELWAATQAPEATRRAAARALGLSPADVVLYPLSIGGSFDRRLSSEEAAQAAVLAKKIGRPVQLVWSRRQEHVAGMPRAPVAAVMGATPDVAGGIAGWRARIVAPAAFREFGERLVGGKTAAEAAAAVAGEHDPVAVDGARPPYAVQGLAIDHIPVATGLPSGRMRGQAHGYTAFFTECFVDEMAHRAGREPLSYRMAMLGHDPRLADCLQRAAALAQWGGGGDNSGQGIAAHTMGAGRIAVVASARRDDEAGFRVDMLSAVVDIGRIVNLDIARQQIEGGLIFGLGLALGCAVGFEGGWPTVDRIGQLSLPGLGECPEIAVDFIDSADDPVDPGELGVAAVAPAIANALFSATGVRYRRLPLSAEDF